MPQEPIIVASSGVVVSSGVKFTCAEYTLINSYLDLFGGTNPVPMCQLLLVLQLQGGLKNFFNFLQRQFSIFTSSFLYLDQGYKSDLKRADTLAGLSNVQ